MQTNILIKINHSSDNILVPLKNSFLMICCLPELVSGSFRLCQGILKRVRNDKKIVNTHCVLKQVQNDGNLAQHSFYCGTNITMKNIV